MIGGAFSLVGACKLEHPLSGVVLALSSCGVEWALVGCVLDRQDRLKTGEGGVRENFSGKVRAALLNRCAHIVGVSIIE